MELAQVIAEARAARREAALHQADNQRDRVRARASTSELRALR